MDELFLLRNCLWNYSASESKNENKCKNQRERFRFPVFSIHLQFFYQLQFNLAFIIPNERSERPYSTFIRKSYFYDYISLAEFISAALGRDNGVTLSSDGRIKN
jgi:hypothetical protein